MKRVIALLLAALLTIGSMSVFADDTAERSGADLPYWRIVEVAKYMRTLVNGDYLDIKQVPETVQSIARTWAAGISDTPRLVVQLDINSLAYMRERQAVFSQEPEIVDYEVQSNVVIEIWQLLAYYASQEAGLTESNYEEIMLINGQINASMMYAEPGREGNAMYIVLFENAAPILLIVSAENDAVSVQGAFLPSTKLAKCKNFGQVSMWLMLNGFTMTCSEILPD